MENLKTENDRLYFIIKSWVMSEIGGRLFLASVMILGSVNFIQSLVIGMIIFVGSLIISRFFDSVIDKVVVKTLNFLNKRNRVKGFILKYF